MTRVRYSSHAEVKIKERAISKRLIKQALKNPDRITSGFYDRIIFEKQIDAEHKIKVVCEKENEVIIVLTSYITRVER